MDLGRYADCILNVTLAVCIFFFPGGYWVSTFCCLLGSHIYIFFLDTYKVLRAVPNFEYGTNKIDDVANYVFIATISCLATAVIFSYYNCDPGWPCEHGM